MTEKKSNYQKAQTLMQSVIALIDEMLPSTGTLAEELMLRKKEAETLNHRLSLTEKLSNAQNKYIKYVILDENGDPEELDSDGVRRYIMGYPKKGAFTLDVLETINRELDKRHNLSEEAAELFRAITGARDTNGDQRPSERTQHSEALDTTQSILS